MDLDLRKQKWEQRRDKWEFIFILSSVTAVQIIVLLLLITFAAPYLFPGPLKYSQDIYYPDDPVLCPGDLLNVHLTFTVNTAPIALGEIISWWNVESNQSVINDDTVSYGWYSETGNYERINSVVVPYLPAGKYEMRGGRQELTRQVDAYKVPFSVPFMCHGGA